MPELRRPLRKRVYRLWGLTNNWQLLQDPHSRPTPYLWSDRKEAEMNADCLPHCVEDTVQRVKVNIEPIGPPRKVRH